MFGLRGPRRSRSSAACGVLGNRRSHRIHCEDCKTGVIGLQISRNLPWYLFHKILTLQMRRQSSRWAGEPGQRGANSSGRHRRVTHESESSDYIYIFRKEDAARTGVRDFQNSHNRFNRYRVQLWLPRLQRPWHDACRTYVYASHNTGPNCSFQKQSFLPVAEAWRSREIATNRTHLHAWEVYFCAGGPSARCRCYEAREASHKHASHEHLLQTQNDGCATFSFRNEVVHRAASAGTL